MSQVNVNPSGPGGPYTDGGAAGVNMLAIVLAILLVIVIAVVAWGATAGNWFSGSTTNNPGGNTTINVSAPARAPGSNTSPITTSPAPSR